jgi:hypothetical protein
MINLRFRLPKVAQPAVGGFAISRFERVSKQLAVNADMGKVNAQCRGSVEARGDPF